MGFIIFIATSVDYWSSNHILTLVKKTVI